MASSKKNLAPLTDISRETSELRKYLVDNNIQAVLDGTMTPQQMLGIEDDEEYARLEQSIDVTAYCTISDELPAVKLSRSTPQVNRSFDLVSQNSALPESAKALAAYYKTISTTQAHRKQLGYKYRKRPEDEIKIIKPLQDQVIRVRVYKPLLSYRTKQQLSQEFVVLGSNQLTQLRDKIFCTCNYGPQVDISNDPVYDVLKPPASNSGFFFFTDTFYNDMRKTENEDLSKLVQQELGSLWTEWDFKSTTMENHTFSELKVRLGHQQLYKHSGNCEHLVVFADVRLISGDDPRAPTFYPFLEKASAGLQKNCDICAHTKPEYYVIGSNRHIQDPAVLCERCYLATHFIDGKKQGTFESYRYFDNMNAVDFDSIDFE